MMDAKQVDRFIQAMERLAAAVERLGAKEKPFTASDNADFLAQADWEKATKTVLKPYNEPARMGAACGNCGQPSFICKGKCRTDPPRTCGECAHWPDVMDYDDSDGTASCDRAPAWRVYKSATALKCFESSEATP